MINALETLRNFSLNFDRRLLRFLETESRRSRKIDPKANLLFAEIFRVIQNGGKRLRPAQLYYSYLACGGKNKSGALKASLSLELLHTMAIIHDDIIDRSNQRRGQETSHEYFKTVHQAEKLTGDRAHFALASAILTGDLAFTLADKALTDSPFPKDLVLKAKKLFDKERLELVAGQFLDVYGEYSRKDVDEKFVLTILKYKTGVYTCGYPLQIGALLAGAGSKVQKALFEAGLKAGTAFQIQDDILGVFGKVSEIGKSASSDLLEGKKTMLTAKALELASQKEKSFLRKKIGNPKASESELNQVRQIIKSSGSLDYSLRRARELVLGAKKILTSLDLKNPGRDFLLSLADFMLQRKF